VTKDFPLRIIGKDEVLEDIALRGVVSDFDKIAAEVRASDQEDFLVVYDVRRTYGENFYVCLTADARRNELERISRMDAEDGEGGGGAAQEDSGRDPGVVIPRGHWASRGSEEDVDAWRVQNTRPLLTISITRRRREFGAPAKFADRDAHDGMSESRSFKDPNYELRRMELEKGVQAVPVTTHMPTQTPWFRPVNMAIQYQAIGFPSEEARQKVLESDTLAAFLRNVAPLFGHALEQNETVNVVRDDYKLLADEDTALSTQAENVMREITSFADLTYCKDRYVSSINWQPGNRGILGVAIAESAGFAAAVENSGKVHSSYLLIWNFADPIQPQLVLESPYDVICFRFNPTRPSLIAGGLINGQVVLWDISVAQENIRKHGRHRDDHAAASAAASAAAQAASSSAAAAAAAGGAAGAGGGGAGGAAADASASKPGGTAATVSKVVPVVPCLLVSSIELSHRRPVTDLQWIEDGRIVGNHGKTGVNSDRASTMFATCASDGQVLFWDTTRPRKDPKKFDLAWAPSHRVPLNRPDGTAAEMGAVKLSIGKPSSGTKFYVATEEGDLIYADWNPSLDEKPRYLLGLYSGHYGNCKSVERSPFMPDVILTAGDWTFSLWKEGVEQPVFTSPASSTYITCALWSPVRPGIIFCGNSSGRVEIWDLTDRSHEPSITQTITSARVESMQFLVAKGAVSAATGQPSSTKVFIAVGDSTGTAHILSMPRSLTKPIPNETTIIENFFEWEVKRVGYMLGRRAFRAEELSRIERDEALQRREEIEDTGAGDDGNNRAGSPDQGGAGDEKNAISAAEAAKAEDEYRAMEATFKAELGITDDTPQAPAEPVILSLDDDDEDDQDDEDQENGRRRGKRNGSDGSDQDDK
jgi:WD40 repeat protein